MPLIEGDDVRPWIQDEVSRQLREQSKQEIRELIVAEVRAQRPLLDPVPIIDAIERCFFDGDGKLFVTALFGLGAMATILAIILHLT